MRVLPFFISATLAAMSNPFIVTADPEVHTERYMPRKAWQKRKKRLQMQRASRVANRYQK